MSNKNADYFFLQGGGEMGKLIRAKDWSTTSLGDPADWPQSLRTMVAIMLDNPFGMYIAWGTDYTQLYNDGYRPILGGTKHPQALGISTRETFSEIWHIIESMFDGVMRGKAVGFPDLMLPLNRNGFVEECYFDFSYSPIRKDNGEVGGVLVTVVETTHKKKAEEALKESEQRFRDTVKQAPVGITILRGKEYMVEMANDAYMQLVDRKETEFVGRPLFDSLPEVQDSVENLLEGVMNNGVPYYGYEVPVPINRNGKQEIFYFDFLYHPLKEKDGEISGIIVTVTEVSDKVAAAKKNKENEKLLQSIFFNAPAAIAVISGPQHTYVLANNKYQKMVNRTEEQLVGKTSKAIFPELIGTGTFEIFDTIYQSGEAFSMAEYAAKLDKNNDGNMEQVYFRFSAVPLKDSEEKFDSIVIVAVDITEQVLARKKIEESEERFRSLAHTLPQLVWVTDAQGNAEFASVRWEEYSGIKPGGEKEWKAIVHPDDYDNINEAWANALATGNTYIAEVRFKSKDGQYKWHAVKGEPIVDKENKIVKWVGAFTDIHEQKMNEERKDEFISIASHEMKTPLTTAKGYLQMLELTVDVNNEDANQYAKKASESVTRLNELIGELLDVSKIRLGKLEYNNTAFDFNDMMDSTVENLQLTCLTHTIIKTGTVYNQVTGDKDRLQQVVINLLNNAIKYSPGSKKVYIMVEQLQDTIQVSVKDTGIGIGKQSLHKIFDKFHRIDEHAVHFQGLGIGLFISHEIIQRHHGKLWAESELDKGSVFYFTLPVTYKAQQ